MEAETVEFFEKILARSQPAETAEDTKLNYCHVIHASGIKDQTNSKRLQPINYIQMWSLFKGVVQVNIDLYNINFIYC